MKKLMKCKECNREIPEKFGRCIVCCGEIKADDYDKVKDISYFKQFHGFWVINEEQFVASKGEYSSLAKYFAMDVKELLENRDKITQKDMVLLKKLSSDSSIPKRIIKSAKHMLSEISGNEC